MHGARDAGEELLFACSVYSEITDDVGLKKSLPLVFTHVSKIMYLEIRLREAKKALS